MIDDYDESSGWMFLLVPAHPGFPGQIPQSRKTVVLCVCVWVERERQGIDDIILALQETGCDGMGMCCKKKTMTGRRNVWCMKWRVQDQEVDQRGFGKWLCKKTVKHVNWTGKMLWIIVHRVPKLATPLQISWCKIVDTWQIFTKCETFMKTIILN